MQQNKKYKLEISTRGEKDLNNIVDYMIDILKNPIAADNFTIELYKKLNIRLLNPLGFQKYHSTKTKNTYYKLSVNNYTVFYIVRSSVVKVKRIIYSKRNLEKLI